MAVFGTSIRPTLLFACAIMAAATCALPVAAATPPAQATETVVKAPLLDRSSMS